MPKVTHPMMQECKEIIDSILPGTGLHVHPNQEKSISWLIKKGEENILEIYGRSKGTRQDTGANKGPKYRLYIRGDVDCIEYEKYLKLPDNCKLFPKTGEYAWHKLDFCWYIPKNELRHVLQTLLK